jgi:hypothetical protein
MRVDGPTNLVTKEDGEVVGVTNKASYMSGTSMFAAVIPAAAKAPACQRLTRDRGGRRLKNRVLQKVFAVLEPAALTATALALTDAEQAHAATLRAFELTVERARCETERARRQYDAMEPENRLVARTLKRALEGKLTAQRHAGRTYSPRKPADPCSSLTNSWPPRRAQVPDGSAHGPGRGHVLSADGSSRSWPMPACVPG